MVMDEVTTEFNKKYMWIQDILNVENFRYSIGKLARYKIKNIIEEKCHIGGLNKSDIANS